MTCHFFLNDHLFKPCETSEDSLKLLARVLSLAEIVLRVKQPVYFSGNLFLSVIKRPDVKVSSVLRSDRELKSRLSRIVQQIEPLDDGMNDSVYCFKHEENTIDVSRSIVAHAYEHVNNDDTSSLLNFKEDYPGPALSVTKDTVAPRIVMSHAIRDELVKFLQSRGLLKRYYSPTDTHVPSDYETILTDTCLFSPTEYGNRKNRLYRRIDEPNQLWSLDRGHTGRSAHLEVFRESDGVQIAVSRVDKICFFRELTAKEKNRRLVKEKMP